MNAIVRRRITNQKRKAIADFLAAYPGASVRDVAEETGIPSSSVQEHLREMSKRGRIARRDCVECGGRKWEVFGEGSAG